MSVWQRIKRWWMGRKQNTNRTYSLGVPQTVSLIDPPALADPTSKYDTSDVLAAGLGYYQRSEQVEKLWDSLSPRYKQVTALVCLGYSNRQIAYLLGLSELTINSYIQNILGKLNLHGKADLRVTFAIWDFSAWDILTARPGS